MRTLKLLLIFCLFFQKLDVFATVESHFHAIKNKPKELYAFLESMPKGGELHYHLAGGAYPEEMIPLAAKNNYCLKKDLSLSVPDKNCSPKVKEQLSSRSKLYQQLLQAWSLENFNFAKHSGHDHFFKTFPKFIPLVFNHRASLLASVIERAARQHEQYMEIMILPDNGQSIAFSDRIAQAKTFQEKQNILLKDKGFLKNIYLTQQETKNLLQKTRQELGCDAAPKKESCQITITFQYYVLREQPLDKLFTQALNGFAAAAGSGNLAAVNMVQPEDGAFTRRDYQEQMKIFQFLHKAYPQVHIALHAGELTPDFASKRELKNHIHEAIFTGHAERIGHGVDILHEEKADETLKYMADHQLPVEINLISNKKILSVSGQNHPLKDYLSYDVPVVFSSDDEGVLRTDLTEQYLEAALTHHLSYKDLKQINRNALTYSFLPGKSFWADAAKAMPVKQCRLMESPFCKQFIAKNPKAFLQWRLEKKLQAFEEQYQG